MSLVFNNLLQEQEEQILPFIIMKAQSVNKLYIRNIDTAMHNASQLYDIL